MVNEITFDKLPQAVVYLTEQVERIHKIVAALQLQIAAYSNLQSICPRVLEFSNYFGQMLSVL